MALRVALMAALLGVAFSGIYPDDHWSYSTKLTSTDDMDKFIKTNVDAGKTAFVRFEKHFYYLCAFCLFVLRYSHTHTFVFFL